MTQAYRVFQRMTLCQCSAAMSVHDRCDIDHAV
ncbi:hypothetical protein AF72_03635 [Xylella taiwanensis]|uniref:Uncharacterized protein n=1 Tax=Xylella taiwanensis TaxID=1444770 RepID=Z9JLM8_9GAMM|nr:hypothetical protein AF72_03635 [Xylella taiwanensis]